MKRNCAASIESVVRLSERSFGSGSVFIERFIQRGRHVEVQIFGDGKGRVLALGERDCSVQRRNQKVFEETPAPGLSDETRSALHAAAVKLGESVNYRSAGTVEFIYDADRDDFFFLEVNTRLQVEHGVTELVTGIDLVEWMVRLALDETWEMPAIRAGSARLRDPGAGLCGGSEPQFPPELRAADGSDVSRSGRAAMAGSKQAPRSVRFMIRC